MRWQTRWAVTMVLAQICAVASMARARAQATPTAVTCAVCHEHEAGEFAGSIHATAGIDCRSCHGGESRYMVDQTVVDRSRQLTSWSATATRLGEPETTTRPAGTAGFDHGPGFKGKPSHHDVPERCGTCHSDVAKMNPYGLPTDQWAQYRESGHGKALYDRKNDKVAVCIDCHGTHDIRKPSDPASSVNAKNVPATCGRCHADPSVMAGTPLSTRVLDEYRQSVHGQGLLEHGDTGMPHCATCHGSHSAVPPGFRDVGHVCGRCHQQEAARFMESPHAKFPGFPRCVACHAPRVDLRDHRIMRVVSSPKSIQKTYAALHQLMPSQTRDDADLMSAYSAQREPRVSSIDALCQRCHSTSRQVGHRSFFGGLDERVLEMGKELDRLVLHSELRYAATAHRVEEAGRGVLLVQDEALGVEEMRTKLVALAGLQHTLNLELITKSVAELDEIADRTERSLDEKLNGLRWRHWGLVPMWIFLIIFMTALWFKYNQLKAAWVKPLEK